MSKHRNPTVWLPLSLILASAGCTTPTTSNTARTATEQLLISNAVDQSLEQVDFRPFRGQSVHVSEAYMDSVDKPYVVGSVRHRLLAAGAKLVEKPEEAQVIVEVRSGGVGTGSSNTFIGVPEIALPGMFTIPELKFAERSRQSGLAKIGLVAYDAKTREVLGTGGMSLAQSTDSNWFVGGVGPFRGGSIREEIELSQRTTDSSRRVPLPHQVAFSAATSPAPMPEAESDIQFASGSEPADE